MTTMNDVSRQPHLMGISPQTVKLIELFKDWKPGDMATDDDMSKLIGRDVRTGAAGGGMGNLNSALKYVERHYGRIIQRQRAQGCVKCLNAVEVVDVVDRRRQHVGRTVRRAGRELSHVDIAKLETVDKTKALALKAQFGVLATIASTQTTKTLLAHNGEDNLAKWQDQQRKMLQAM